MRDSVKIPTANLGFSTKESSISVYPNNCDDQQRKMAVLGASLAKYEG